MRRQEEAAAHGLQARVLGLGRDTENLLMRQQVSNWKVTGQEKHQTWRDWQLHSIKQ
jgi:hypothetical protein